MSADTLDNSWKGLVTDKMPTLEKKKPASAITGRGRGEQDVGTPRILLRAIIRTFGSIGFDLAASATNHVKKDMTLCFTPEDDALSPDTKWPRWRRKGRNWDPSDPLTWNWLNPEFANVYPWVARTQFEAENRRVDTLFHVPASVDTQWWADYVDGKCWWVSLKGRVVYRGAKQGYPRPLVLCLFSELWQPHDGLRKLGFLGYSGENRERPWPTTPSYLGQWDWKHVIKIISKEQSKRE